MSFSKGLPNICGVLHVTIFSEHLLPLLTFGEAQICLTLLTFCCGAKKVHFAPDLRWKEKRECQNYSEILTKLQSNENQAAQNHDTPQLSLLKISYQLKGPNTNNETMKKFPNNIDCPVDWWD